MQGLSGWATQRAKMRKKLSKVWGKIRKIDWDLRKVELLPTWDCAAGYSPAQTPVGLHLSVTHDLTKSQKKMLVLCAKTFQMIKPKFIMQVIVVQLNKSCYECKLLSYCVFQCEVLFFAQFRSFWNMLPFVSRHFPMIECEFQPLLNQSLTGHRLVKCENYKIICDYTLKIIFDLFNSITRIMVGVGQVNVGLKTSQTGIFPVVGVTLFGGWSFGMTFDLWLGPQKESIT